MEIHAYISTYSIDIQERFSAKGIQAKETEEIASRHTDMLHYSCQIIQKHPRDNNTPILVSRKV